MVFLVGIVFNDTTGIDEDIRKEASFYGDIIQEAVAVESYFYLTLKVGKTATIFLYKGSLCSPAPIFLALDKQGKKEFFTFAS